MNVDSGDRARSLEAAFARGGATQGYQILAVGPDRYLEMGVTCAQSLRRIDPKRPIQLVTDRSSYTSPLFSEITEFRYPELSGPLAKLKLHEHAVFDQTMYIDSDCIAFRDVEFFWTLLQTQGVALLGTKKTEGKWHGGDLADWCRRFGIPYVVKTNTGFMFITKQDATRELFETAWAIWQEFGNFTERDHRGLGPPQEPFIGVASGRTGLDPLPWNTEGGGRLMQSTLGSSNWVFNLEQGIASFKKEGMLMSPCIVHFVRGRPKSHYLALASELRRNYDA
jgi:hypothetical protein